MDQRELVRQLEAHFRKEDAMLLEHWRATRHEQDSLSDEEWWIQLVSKTEGIRPEMMAVFERNKEEMIRNRPKRIGSEEGFREKNIQKKVMELLPYVSKFRAEREAVDDITDEEIYVASMRMHAESMKSTMGQFENGKDNVANPRKRESLDLFVVDAKAHLAEMEEFMDPKNLTEEKWDAHSKRLHERMEGFQKKAQDIMKKKPGDLN